MSNTERVLYFPEGKIMKTIICDDEKSTCSELEEIILKYAKEKSVSLVTEVFYSGDTLLDYLKREKINILFLDIELPGKDGVMVGKYIREVLEEENLFLIYISSKENYALQLFQNRPFDFLVKPIIAHIIKIHLRMILQLLLPFGLPPLFVSKRGRNSSGLGRMLRSAVPPNLPPFMGTTFSGSDKPSRYNGRPRLPYWLSRSGRG